MKSCNICDKILSSTSSLYVHKREKHTFKNTLIINCSLCLNDFNSVKMNKKKIYEKCEDCRDLINKLNIRSSIKNNSIFYDKENKKRYKIQSGKLVEKCIIFNCNENINCKNHDQKNFKKCKKIKCNNCFIIDDFNYCNKCRNDNIKSKDNYRLLIKNFKKELGGKCVMCGFDDLFFLEFDHILPNNKIKQITRSSPTEWRKEINNLQLLCGRCHRYKTFLDNENNKNNIYSRGKKHRNKKRDFLHNLKKNIGFCQICKWSSNNENHLLCALDFDHLDNYIKKGNLSKLYSIQFIKEEIKKTRLICRHCHELYTCFQKGGNVLNLYYSQDIIEILRLKVYP